VIVAGRAVDAEALLAAREHRLGAAEALDHRGRDRHDVRAVVFEAAVRDLGVHFLIRRDDAVRERAHRLVIGERLEVRLFLDVGLRLVVHVADAEDGLIVRGLASARGERGERDRGEKKLLHTLGLRPNHPDRWPAAAGFHVCAASSVGSKSAPPSSSS
jgi:hypothetical protein